MKTINVFEQFGERNLGNKSRVVKVVNGIDVKESNHIVLNLSKCFIDYPYAALLIDKVLESIVKEYLGKSILEIVYDFNCSESTILNTLFNGSIFLSLSEDKSYSVAEIKLAISSLTKHEITMDLIIVDRNESEIRRMRLC